MFVSSFGIRISDFIMRILIAPDKFKGALDARKVADNIARGIHDVSPDVQIEIVALADGGEGTAEVICDGLRGSWLKCRAHDPLGREIEARWMRVKLRTISPAAFTMFRNFTR